ncbi:hypothetical protein BC834DRAFT_103981 [Gloeopeniophorella convolvens]|nr:hypothetical protein BC834DRAFT_103981 [Gloeopeniophorella convolvens]
MPCTRQVFVLLWSSRVSLAEAALVDSNPADPQVWRKAIETRERSCGGACRGARHRGTMQTRGPRTTVRARPLVLTRRRSPHNRFSHLHARTNCTYSSASSRPSRTSCVIARHHARRTRSVAVAPIVQARSCASAPAVRAVGSSLWRR